MLELGVNPHASTPEEMTEYINSDIVKWGQVIEKAKIEKQ